MNHTVPAGWIKGKTITVHKQRAAYVVTRVFEFREISTSDVGAIWFHTVEELTEWMQWWFS